VAHGRSPWLRRTAAFAPIRGVAPPRGGHLNSCRVRVAPCKNSQGGAPANRNAILRNGSALARSGTWLRRAAASAPIRVVAPPEGGLSNFCQVRVAPCKNSQGGARASRTFWPSTFSAFCMALTGGCSVLATPQAHGSTPCVQGLLLRLCFRTSDPARTRTRARRKARGWS